MKKITYGFHDSPFGKIVLAKTDKGLFWLGFMTKGYKGDGLARMKKFYKDSELIRDDRATKTLAAQVMRAWKEGKESSIRLDIEGTPFQKSVWKSLLKIRKGKLKTYGEVANDIKNPKAVRAVGTAVGQNPVSLIVPCHRVVPSAGGVGNYGWGSDLKKKILKAENVAT